MSFDYSGFRDTADRLLTKFGKSITLQRTVDGSYDPETGGTSPSTSNLSGQGILVRYKNMEIDGTTVQSSDRKLIYSGDEPQIDDEYQGWRIVTVDPLDPDESGPIIYICQMRK